MHSGFIHQDTNTKVSMIFNNNRSFSAESEEPNTIITFIFSGGRYEYIVQYANPVGNLKSRGARTLSDAVADAKSGENGLKYRQVCTCKTQPCYICFCLFTLYLREIDELLENKQ